MKTVNQTRIDRWVKKTGIATDTLTRIAVEASTEYELGRWESGWTAGAHFDMYLPFAERGMDGKMRNWGDFLIALGDQIRRRKNGVPEGMTRKEVTQGIRIFGEPEVA